MKPLHYILLGFLTILLGTYIFDKYFQSSPLNELTPDVQRGYALLEAAQEICVTSQSQSLSVGVEGVLKTKNGSISGTVGDEKLRGALTYLNDEIRSLQDSEIRSCMEKRWPQIEACLMDNCDRTALPGSVAFQFTYEFEDASNTNFDPAHVAFAIQNRPITTLVQQPPELFYPYNIDLPSEGDELYARIHRVVRESYSTDTSQATALCLKRASQLAINQPSHTRFNCSQSAGTCQHDILSPRWFDHCPAQDTSSFSGFNLFPAAHADTNENTVWRIPSISTLESRDDFLGQGYTKFAINTAPPTGKTVDGYFVALKVNNQPVHIDGMPPSFSVIPTDGQENITFEFGLQNLNFSGHAAGCDFISASVHFVNKGIQIGSPITIARSYVALRDPASTERSLSDANKVTWTGKYVRAPKQYDNEVFVNSIWLTNDISRLATHPDVDSAKINIVKMKDRFDKLALRYNEQRLVSVIRPPLTKVSYGLAVGIVEPTGQIRFTYSNEEARNLKSFLLSQRVTPQAKRAIRSDMFIYSVRGDKDHMVSPPVC